jgi:ferredoxin
MHRGAVLVQTRVDGRVLNMKINVNYDLCEANAICMAVAPEVFEVRDDDNLYLLTEDPSEDLRPKLEEAVRRCPKQALSIEG